MMFWIPIVFVCTTVCGLLQGQPSYTEKDCLTQLAYVKQHLEQDPRVMLYHLECAQVKSI
jgi:hypothetical protein